MNTERDLMASLLHRMIRIYRTLNFFLQISVLSSLLSLATSQGFPHNHDSYLFISTRKPVTAFIGETVTLACVASFEWESVEVYWLFNGYPVHDVRPDYEVTETVNVADTVTTNELIIHNAGEMDAGLFTCASQDMPHEDSVNVFIQIEPILQPMPDFILTEGERFVLTCLVVPPIHSGRMYWYKNERLIGTTGQHDLNGDKIPDGEILNDGSLVMYEPDRTDAGVYTCLLRYVVSSKSKFIKKNINVNVAVWVTVEEYIKLGTDLFEPIKISCTAYGYPVPDVTWLSKNFTLGGDGHWGRDIAVTTRKHSPISVVSTITIEDLPGEFAMASVRCDARNFFSNHSQLSIIIKFGNGTVALLDGTQLDDANALKLGSSTNAGMKTFHWWRSNIVIVVVAVFKIVY